MHLSRGKYTKRILLQNAQDFILHSVAFVNFMMVSHFFNFLIPVSNNFIHTSTILDISVHNMYNMCESISNSFKGGRPMPESLLSRYMDTNEASKVWGYPRNTVSRWCQQGKIPGAIQAAPCCPWFIPRNAKCPKAKNG